MYAHILKITKAEFLTVLKKKKKQKRPVGYQKVPMDIEKINASLTAANS